MQLVMVAAGGATELRWDSNCLTLTAKQADVLVQSRFWDALEKSGWSIAPTENPDAFTMSREKQGRGGLRFHADASLWEIHKQFAEAVASFNAAPPRAAA